jgi:HTH-type transcriptional regulator, cell division transcriptional repressor
MQTNIFLGERITNARLAKGITQEKLAELCGVKKSTLVKWETDQSSPRINRLNQMAGILGVSVVWLLAGDETLLDVDTPTLNETMMLENKLDAAEAMIDQLKGIIRDIRLQSKRIQNEFDQEAL